MLILRKWVRYVLTVISIFFLTQSFKTQANNTMESKIFILIKGSWHSAQNWHKVTPLLEKPGHKVYAIDLPRMGRDKTPIRQVTFEKTVQRLCALIDSIDGKIILVGHSKNGIMISQAAEFELQFDLHVCTIGFANFS